LDIQETLMAITQTTVFKNNQTQAVRLPKSVALPESVKRVDIIVQGNTRIITPAGGSWESWFSAEGVSDDFMPEREQPVDQQREGF